MPKQELTPELARIIEIARNIWWSDGAADVLGSRLLSAALAAAFPEDVQSQETCTCGEPCEECVPQSYVEAEIAFMENYMTRWAEISAAAESADVS